MTIQKKQLRNGFELPVLGFGTWTIGGRMEPDTTNDDSDIQGIQNAIAAGITHIDTAEKYAAGHSEELIGQAIKAYDRKKLFVTSKVAPANLSYNHVITSCKNTLKRLQIDYLDLYLIHAPNDQIPIEETMHAFDELKAEGLIKNIGVSNFTTKRLIEAQQYTKNKIVVNQVFYNLIYRQPEKDGLLDYCQKNDVMLVAFRPVERGLLTQSTNDLIESMCKKYSKTASQIAINWLVTQKNVVVIAKMSTNSHLKENLAALNWTMENEDVEKIKMHYPNQQNTSDTPLR